MEGSSFKELVKVWIKGGRNILQPVITANRHAGGPASKKGMSLQQDTPARADGPGQAHA
ncbi:hypothetical protein J27TS7_34910 [Paenibacillus dendritiformis]|nr:hypothetical protein J27TS7_34910 [Paenibacillus dendritiformis]